jgi:GntR family transcriptional regulator, transcriptional repressor for pyruvate dehydrogenase complex
MSKLPKDTLNSTPGQYIEPKKVTGLSTVFRHAEETAVSKANKSYNTNLLRAPSRAEKIIPVLVEYISDMKLVPGSKLPSEAELSNIVGVGIKAVRDALQTLKMLGLVESQTGAGWFITEFKPLVKVPSVLAPLLERFSQVNIRTVFEARLGIEPLIAELAARNRTPDGLVKLGEKLEDIRKVAMVNGVSRELMIADRKFHDALAEMCGNDILLLQNSLLSGLFLSMTISITEPNLDINRFLREHEEIYKKVEARDAEDVAMAAKRHVEWTIQLIDKYGLGLD